MFSLIHKKFYFLLVFVFFSIFLKGQIIENPSELGLLDVYLLKVRIDTILINVNCKCHYNKHLYKNASLVKMDVIDILIMNDSSVFSKDQLFKLNYAIVPLKITEKLSPNNFYVLSFFNSNHKKYLIANKGYITNDNFNFNTLKQHAFVFGLTKCRIKSKLFDNIPAD